MTSKTKYFIGSLLLIINVIAIFSCKTSKAELSQDIKPALVLFSDSTESSKRIISDDIDGFFDIISPIDMKIQMKDTSGNQDRIQLLKTYKEYLQRSVSDWTIEEKSLMHNVFTQVKLHCDGVNPRVYPSGIRLIKIKANHYGPDVYYTRGRNILVPENVFDAKDDFGARQMPIMIHEVFHIISRYNPTLREKAYKLIGFEKQSKAIQYNPELKNVLLTNPDGVSTDYSIVLNNESKKISVLPAITSKWKVFNVNRPSFFDYLQFDLFPINEGKTMSDKDGKTQLDLAFTPSFFFQIKDNTQYIIHPDEIMADNFMLGLQANVKNDYKNFTKEGKVLIDGLLDILKQL